MTKKVFDLYGLKAGDLSEAKTLVENVLALDLLDHESGYHCGEYYRSHEVDIDDESFILQKNYDDFEDEWTEESFTDFPILLFVNDTKRSSEITSLFESQKGVTLLRHQEI